MDIEKLDGVTEKGTKITFDKVLLTDNGKETQVGAPYVSPATVAAELVKEGRDKKISVIRYRAKRAATSRSAATANRYAQSPHHHVAVTHKPDLWVLSSAFQRAFDGFGVGVFEFGLPVERPRPSAVIRISGDTISGHSSRTRTAVASPSGLRGRRGLFH